MNEPLPSNPLLSIPDQIARQMQAHIAAHHKPGDRLPTVIELAAKFDVSKHSVTNALEILARTGLITKRQGRGVFVASRPARLRIGILSELDLFDHRISHHFRAVASALRARLEQDADVQLYMGHAPPGGRDAEPTCPRFWADVADQKLDAAIVLNVPATSAWYHRLANSPIPLVAPMIGYDVQIDTTSVIKSAVRQLAVQGCKRLALIAWMDSDPFKKAVKKAGLTTRDEWIKCDLDPSVRGAGWEEFREIWSTPGKRPDGLIILDDMLFFDAQIAIIQTGIQVPRDLRLVVQTNRDVSPPIRLPITALEVDAADRADAYASLLRERLANPSLPPVVRLISHRQVELGADARPASTSDLVSTR